MSDSKQRKPDPVALFGFPPKEDPKGARRLHERPGSATYVEIKDADIVDPPPQVKHGREPDESVIWVRPDARVLLAELPLGFFDPGKPRRWPR